MRKNKFYAWSLDYSTISCAVFTEQYNHVYGNLKNKKHSIIISHTQGNVMCDNLNLIYFINPAEVLWTVKAELKNIWLTWWQRGLFTDIQS